MGNIISFFQEIFMLKESNGTKIGLANYRDDEKSSVERPVKAAHAPKELRLSDLMRKGSC